MLLRALLFVSIVLGVLGGVSLYAAQRSMALCPPLAGHPALVLGGFGLLAALMIALPFLLRVPGLARHLDPLSAVAYGWFGCLSTFVVFLAVADLAQALLGRFAHLHAGPWAFALAVAATVAALGLGLATALRPVATVRVTVPIAGLPEGLDGLRILQISDLHLGPLVRRAQVEHIVAAGNALQPDLVAITGDLVDGDIDALRAKAERLGALRARHGVCYVTGNHEYYCGAPRWIALFRAMGWRVLDNEHVLLEHRGAQLAVAGMPDPSADPGPDLARALAGIPESATRLLLFHRPTGTEAAARAGVHLQLSGHTHAGQYFPWSLLVPALFAHPRGLGRSGAMWIYTSVGTGFWGPPNRFLVPPELTLLTLVRA